MTQDNERPLGYWKKRPLGHWIGFVITVLGGSLLGGFISKQLKVTEPGDNYYIWMVGAVAISALGVCIILASRPRK
jgi:hypothetical protein